MLWRNNPTSRHAGVQNIKEQFEKPSCEGEDSQAVGSEGEESSAGSDVSSGFWNPTRKEQDQADEVYEAHPGWEFDEGGESESIASDATDEEPRPLPHAKPLIEDETSDWDVEGVPTLPGDEERHIALARKHLASPEPCLHRASEAI